MIFPHSSVSKNLQAAHQRIAQCTTMSKNWLNIIDLEMSLSLSETSISCEKD